MQFMDIIDQLWDLPPANPDWGHLLRQLNRLQDRHPAKAVVCGLYAPKDVYSRIIARARKDGTAVYLWLPVFSELDEHTSFDPLIDWRGNAFLDGREPMLFRFRCPESPRNRQLFFQDSLERLQAGDFDGVFLDRIRYPSFQFGLSGVLGCFCPHCLKRYEQMGLNPDALRAACERLESRIGQGESNPLGLTAFDGHRWQLQDPSLQALFDARCTILEESLSRLCKSYRDRGYKIGLDLFTPALSWFAGQDFGHLTHLADFVKPMMYLHTKAPAGIPYELDAVARSTGEESKKTLLALGGGETADALAIQEIIRMNSMARGRSPAVPVFCGMEYNRVPHLAPVGPEQILHSLRVFRSAGVQGVMPAWSLMSAPEENVNALIAGLEAGQGSPC